MLKKIINGIKTFLASLNQEEKRQLLSSLGLVVLGFTIFFLWQFRLPEDEPVPDEPPPEEETEEPEDDENETEENGPERPEETTIDSDLGYEISGPTDRITEREQTEIFGVREYPEFAMEYKDIIHAAYELRSDESLEDWINTHLERKAPMEENREERKRALNILSEQKASTVLGDGKKFVRLDEKQTEEFFVTRDGYVLQFYYHTEAGSISELRNQKETLMESIQ